MAEQGTTRVCLINPPLEGPYPPLGLAYLSSYLKKYGKYNYDIKIIDGNCSKDVLSDILKFNPAITGFSALSPQIKETVVFSQEIRAKRPDIFQVIGGVHVSSEQERTLENGGFDLAVLGEGEETFSEIVDSFIEYGKDMERFKKIHGLAFINDSKLITTPARAEIADLDSIPAPDRTLLNMSYYLSHYLIIRGLLGNRITTIHTSRGCPFDCTFCSSTIIFKKVRYNSVDYVVSEIKELIDRFKIKSLFFTDDTFILNKPRIVNLCKRIIEEGIHKKMKWEVQGRANLIGWQDLGLLRMMKEAGCVQIDYGFESGSDTILEFLKKKEATVAQNRLAMEVTKEAGLKVMGTFMLGVPGEREEDIELTKNFILENNKSIDNFQVFTATPYPGAELYEICRKRNLVKDDYFDQIRREESPDFLPFYSDTVSYDKVLKIENFLNKLALRKLKLGTKLHWVFFNFILSPLKTIKKILNTLKW